MNILLDTSAYSALGRGQAAVLQAIDDADAVFMSPIVIGELRYGYLKGTKPALNEKWLNTFLKKNQVTVSDIGEEISSIYAELKHIQQQKGHTLAINDLWIAATAIHLGAVLVTYDTDFMRIDHPGLQLRCLG